MTMHLPVARSLCAAALITAATAAGAIPVLHQPENGAVNPVMLTWSDWREGPYSVYLDTTPTDIDLFVTLSQTSLTVTSLLAPGTYYWQVANHYDERSLVRYFYVRSTTTEQVPEPASWVLIATALAAAAALSTSTSASGPSPRKRSA